MKHLPILFLSCLTTVSIAQTAAPAGPMAESNLRALGSPGSSLIRTFNDRYEGVKGTPFLDDKWNYSEIVLTKGDTIETLVKLDIYHSEVWAMLSKGDSIIVDQGLIKSFTLLDAAGKRKQTFLFYVARETGYYELLYPGKDISLLCKRKKDLKKAVISGSYTSGNPYDEFVNDDPSYYVLKNNKLYLLRAKKNELINLLGKGVEGMIEGKKLDFSNEAFLIDLVKEGDKSAPSGL